MRALPFVAMTMRLKDQGQPKHQGLSHSSMGKWGRKCAASKADHGMKATRDYGHGGTTALREYGHGTKKVFFGNIPPDMPEAQFLEIVQDKVGTVATIKQNNPGQSSGLNKSRAMPTPRINLMCVCLCLGMAFVCLISNSHEVATSPSLWSLWKISPMSGP